MPRFPLKWVTHASVPGKWYLKQGATHYGSVKELGDGFYECCLMGTKRKFPSRWEAQDWAAGIVEENIARGWRNSGNPTFPPYSPLVVQSSPYYRRADREYL